ncbi:hypothetical protein L2E82_42159 [Cichorium intybus]|uniref:Uncharacterized protein n=1 Tax=Cichorium intybus TaxID=13427 RepID=A0ACB8ZM15_CICIN|nr:hypothetical protein L2E82_42159 [Cichorium intybus]
MAASSIVDWKNEARVIIIAGKFFLLTFFLISLSPPHLHLTEPNIKLKKSINQIRNSEKEVQIILQKRIWRNNRENPTSTNHILMHCDS